MIKKLAILGSTGSIGQQTLDVVRALPGFRVIGLAAGNNAKLLAKQIEEFKPAFVFCQSTLPECHEPYQTVPMEEMAASPEADIVVIATSGKAGLGPALAAIRAGKTIALANKEALVMAGEIVTREAKQYSARIHPVDSEHSAIWQCLENEDRAIARLILTASGGPFYGYSSEQLGKVTISQALDHPSWKMGPKVTIDSATLMNKGLEVIEAHWLFSMPFEKISVLVHPQSIIHSMVELVDGSIKAQLSLPDMRLPIQYALTYPQRLPNSQIRHIDWSALDRLTFAQPDYDTFPCLKMAIEAGKRGGTYPAVLCAADEVAVELFLNGAIKFTDIPALIRSALDEHKSVTSPSLEEILAADSWARERTKQFAMVNRP